MLDTEVQLFYLHGFNSSPDGRTASTLKQHYRDQITLVSYDYIDPEKAIKQIQSVVAEYWMQKELVFIGSSLGGFWANFWAHKTSEKCVLINPSLNPSTSLRKYIGANKNFNTGVIKDLTEANCVAYERYEKPFHKIVPTFCLLGKNDTTLDYKMTIQQLPTAKIVLTEGGHRIEDIQLLIETIDEMGNTFGD
jgi:predicted esterase YcpF (UPF0227 family)